jgi:hypothetical protein
MATPESKAKAALAAYLISIGCCPAAKALTANSSTTGWFFSPVPMGRGVAGVHDTILTYRGHFGSIEVKAPGRRGEPHRGMSAHQHHQERAITLSGAFTMVFDGGEDDWQTLKGWIAEIDSKEGVK